MRILLTEDAPQLGRATQMGLEQAGYAVDRVAGMDAGADDCIVKPFDLDELAARMRSAAGRTHEELVHGDIVIDVAARQVLQAGVAMPLTGKALIRTVHAIGYSIDKPATPDTQACP